MKTFTWRARLLLTAGAGLLGFAVFMFAMPRLHPDAVIDSQAPEEALAEALRLVPEIATPAENVQQEISLRRNARLLSNLQKEFGLRGFSRSYRTGDLEPLPIYYYSIRWTEPNGPDEGRRQIAEVRMLPGGGLVHVDVGRLPGQPADPAALEAAGLHGEVPALERTRFAPQPGVRPVDGETEGTAVDAEAMARYHLERTAFAGLSMHVDSVMIIGNDDLQVARVLMSADTLIAERRLELEVEVRSDGALRKLSIRELRRPDSPAATSDFTVNAGGRSDASGIVVVVVHLLLFVLILGLFFRRVSARMVDFKFALRDGLWAAAWAMVAVAATAGNQVMDPLGVTPLGLLVAALLVIAAGAAATFIVFIVAGVGDSYQRAISIERLRSLDLVRRLRFVNRPVGYSLTAGVALAGVLLGVQSLGMAIPGVSLQLGETISGETSVRPFVSTLGGSMWMASYVIFALIAVPTGFFSGKRWWIGALASVLLLGMTDIAPVAIEPIWMALAVSIVLGAVLVAMSRVFDLVTAAVALMLTLAIASTSSSWMIPQAVALIDGIAIGIVALTLLTVGVAGLLWGDGVDARETFIPDYVREIGRQQRMERELEIARSVQQSLLPRTIPSIEGLDIATMCVPATEVGGDYFDFIRIDEHRLGVIIGDVSGKGIQAAFYMTLVKGIVQTLAAREPDPLCVLSRLNEHFYMNAPRGTFISVVYGVVDLREGTFCFARAGHNPVLVRRAAHAEYSQPKGMAIGLLSGDRFAATLENHCVQLEPGDVVLLYTDGITEAMDASRNLFGETRLASIVAGSTEKSAMDLLGDVTLAVSEFTSGAEQSDDMTAVLIQRATPASSPREDLSATLETISL